MKSFFKRKNKNNSGVTLLEALVAISIFTGSILAMVSVVASGVSNTNYAKTKIVASFLAQEGIEYVRNMRDTYVLYDGAGSQNGWNNFVNRLASSSCQSTCYFDSSAISYTNDTQAIRDIQLVACSGACPPLLYDSSTGKYGYSGGTDYGFRRQITTTQVSANEIKVVSTVSWRQGSGTYNMVYSESLYNWIE